jgi:hypothetical protein
MTKFKPINISLDEDTHEMSRHLKGMQAQSLSSLIRSLIRQKYAEYEKQFDAEPTEVKSGTSNQPDPQKTPAQETHQTNSWAPWIRKGWK